LAGDAPDHVDGLALVVLLQDKDARPLVIGRVLFDHGTLPGTFKDILHKNTISLKPISSTLNHFLSVRFGVSIS